MAQPFGTVGSKLNCCAGSHMADQGFRSLNCLETTPNTCTGAGARDPEELVGWAKGMVV